MLHAQPLSSRDRIAADQWSEWLPLQQSWRSAPGDPGLYRVRRQGAANLDYIGQTGVGVRRRLSMLRGIYGPEMPYRDPHTVAPALWAMRNATRCEFETSWI